MYEMRLTAPKKNSLLVELTQPLNTDTAELVQQGYQIKRFFIPAGEKLTMEIEPGDETNVSEYDKSYKTLEELVAGETAKREEEVKLARLNEAVMPELRAFGEGDYDGEPN